jgi:lipid-binding SYLF domain-containing protein
MPRSIASFPLLLLFGLTLTTLTGTAHAAREVLDAEVNGALEELYSQSPKARELGERAAGILVFPRIYKAGFVLGGAMGDGALRVQGQTVQYYRTTGVSFGLLAGAQVQTQVLMFMRQDALASFRASENWQAGVDGSVALINIGAAKAVNTDTDNSGESIVGFIFANQGLMGDLSFKGNKYWKIVAE